MLESIGPQVAGDRFRGVTDPTKRAVRSMRSAQRQGLLPDWYPGRSANSVMTAAYDKLRGWLDGLFGRDRLARLGAPS